MAEDESGWLLEKIHEGNVHYVCADSVLQWTDDPNKALRLARREDAEALTTVVEDCEKIASHEWPAATSSPAPAGSNDDVEVPPQAVVIQGIVERAGKARAELAGILQVPAVWPSILSAVKERLASAPAENTRVEGEQLAIEIVGTVFDNTGASHETLKATMIERITDWLHRAPSDSARRAAEEIVPNCLSRTCFIRDCNYNHCWGYDDSKAERERVSAIISKHFAAAQPITTTGRVVNISTHGEPTRARLREIETSVNNGYEREYRELGWPRALQTALRDLHFLLTFFRDDVTSAATPADNDSGDSAC